MSAVTPGRVFLLVLLAFPLVAAHAEAALRVAATCSRTDVGNAVAAAQDGDTVVIPSGTCSWTTQLDVTKGITVRGSGIDKTVLRDNVVKNGGATSSLISVLVPEPKSFRISDFTIEGVAPDLNVFNKGHIHLNGTSKAFRVDHVKFTSQQTNAIEVIGYLWGVIDHCEFNGDFKQGIIILHDEWGGSSWGDGSWAESLYLGTAKAVYIEDNVFNEQNLSNAAGAVDSYEGGRYVFRHNVLNGQAIVSHGADSSQRSRSQRSFEIYENQFNRSATFARAIFVRGGTGVIFSNTFGGGYDRLAELTNYRDTLTFPPWGTCNGTGPYDQNSASGVGYRCVDQPGAGTSLLLSSGNPPLPPQWVGNTLDPIYQWNNVHGGISNPTTVVSSANVVLNRDFYNNIARPAYTPYTYPHPLTLGSGSAPSAPTNLRIIP